MQRRQFIQSLSALGLANFLLPYSTLAQTADDGLDQFFVLITVDGGWDVTLSLDPLIHGAGLTNKDVFLEYAPDKIFRSGKLSLAPAAQALNKHARDIHVIKGVEMRRDAGHETNREIMASGYGDGFTASYPIELAAVTQVGPKGVLIDSQVLTANRMVVLSGLGGFGGEGQIDTTKSMLIDDDEQFNLAKNALIAGKAKDSEIQAHIAKMVQEGFTDVKYNSLVSAFATRASYQAAFAINQFFLDTHDNHEKRHFDAQVGIWNEIATLFDYFKATEFQNGESLFARTTFMVVSEFSRTPALNAAMGKDHNPHANAVLMAGRGIQGGSSSGGSKIIKKADSLNEIAEHISLPIDYKTGTVVTAKNFRNNDTGLIFPENIAASIGQIFGNPPDYHKGRLKVKPIPGLAKI